jgi:hypothetical protein
VSDRRLSSGERLVCDGRIQLTRDGERFETFVRILTRDALEELTIVLHDAAMVSFAKIGEARNAGRLAPVDGVESGKDMRPCTF